MEPVSVRDLVEIYVFVNEESKGSLYLFDSEVLAAYAQGNNGASGTVIAQHVARLKGKFREMLKGRKPKNLVYTCRGVDSYLRGVDEDELFERTLGVALLFGHQSTSLADHDPVKRSASLHLAAVTGKVKRQPAKGEGEKKGFQSKARSQSALNFVVSHAQ